MANESARICDLKKAHNTQAFSKPVVFMAKKEETECRLPNGKS